MKTRRNTTGGSEPFFDAHPITLEGFELRARSAVPIGRPTFEHLLAAITFATKAEEASPYWVGDLMRYADSRKEWTERLEMVMDLTGLARQTIVNYSSICRRVQGKARELAPTIRHSDAVAKLEPAAQETLLDRARTENWPVSVLRSRARGLTRPTRLEGQAVLSGMYRVIYAAPRWSQFSIAELCALPVMLHSAADSVLFMWAPAHLVLANPGAREVLEAWGFTYRTHAVWDRVLPSFGSYVQATHEDLVIATRGDCLPDVPESMPKSVFVERRRADDFDSKPEHIRKNWIERLYTVGPYLQLFGSDSVDGWTVLGNDPAQWFVQMTEELQREHRRNHPDSLHEQRKGKAARREPNIITGGIDDEAEKAWR